MNKVAVGNWNELEDRKPAYALVADVDPRVVLVPPDLRLEELPHPRELVPAIGLLL